MSRAVVHSKGGMRPGELTASSNRSGESIFNYQPNKARDFPRQEPSILKSKFVLSHSLQTWIFCCAADSSAGQGKEAVPADRATQDAIVAGRAELIGFGFHAFSGVSPLG